MKYPRGVSPPNPTMAMSKAEYLPEELIIDIFYRLPVNPIGRCRCLSKQWRDFLSDPQSIRLHFNLHVHNQEEKLILVSWRSQLHTITLNHNPPDEIHGISRKLHFQDILDNWISIPGSCNGLCLVVGRKNIVFLINPTTSKYHKIPVFDLGLPLEGSCYMYGFGYDVVSDDYKVVSLSHHDTNNEYRTDTYVDIYSVRKGLWKQLGISPYDHSLSDRASGVLVNGALHWLACRTYEYSTLIASFDLTDEKFLEIPGPTVLGNNCFMCNLAALKGCLCISSSISRDLDTVTFWVMKEYGVKESWTKFKITQPNLDDSLSTLLFSINDDDDVLLDVDEELVVYNMKENQWKDLLIDVNVVTHEARTFVDSLVSPDFSNETEG